MIAVIQRVTEASVSINNQLESSINEGFLILVGVTQADSSEDVNWLAKKILQLRIFSDDKGKMNLNLSQINGSILLVSQFTLLGDVRKGNRPSFTEAADPSRAEELYLLLAEELRNGSIPVSTGVFGADMQIHLLNDGPVTILLNSSDRLKPRNP